MTTAVTQARETVKTPELHVSGKKSVCGEKQQKQRRDKQ